MNDALISGAYGGFSAVWGAQLLPFPDEAFEAWPLSGADIAPHYRAVLTAIPYAAADDDLATVLPLHATPQTPMPLSPRAAAVDRRYRRHRVALNKKGLVLGRSRLAVRSDACIACGMCMTGCPYSLIYSAAHTFDDLRSRRRVDYHGGMVVGLSEGPAGATVVARETASGTERSFAADRVFVGCGAVGTTRLVLGSLRRYSQDVVLKESAQFVLPFVSFRSTGDPRYQSAHALGQLSAVIKLRDVDESQLHLQMYTYDPAFLDALPRLLQGRLAKPLLSSVLSRLSVGLGYLPSSASPRLRIRLNAPTSESQRAPLVITRDGTSPDPRRRPRTNRSDHLRCELHRAGPCIAGLTRARRRARRFGGARQAAIRGRPFASRQRRSGARSRNASRGLRPRRRVDRSTAGLGGVRNCRKSDPRPRGQSRILALWAPQ